MTVIDAVPLSSDYRWHWLAKYLWRPRWGELTTPLLTRPVLDLVTRLQRPRFSGYPKEWLDHIAEHLDRDTKDSILRLYRSADPEVLGRHGARLGELTCPALLIWGAADPYVGPGHVETFAAQLGSDPERWIIPRAGHWVMLDEPAVFDRVSAFIASASTTR